MAKGKFEELEKEMNLMKETQAGFPSDNSNSRLPNQFADSVIINDSLRKPI